MKTPKKREPKAPRRAFALAVKFRSGAGPHKDRRLKRTNRRTWRQEEW